MNRLGRKAPRVIPAIPAPKGLKVIPVMLARRENPAPLVLDGKGVKAIAFTADSTGKITGGTVTFTDDSTAAITVTTATA